LGILIVTDRGEAVGKVVLEEEFATKKSKIQNNKEKPTQQQRESTKKVPCMRVTNSVWWM